MPCYVQIPVADMHKESDAMSEMVSQGVYGTGVEVMEEGSEWRRIQTPDGYRGWVKGECIMDRKETYPSSSRVGIVAVVWTHVYRVKDTEPHSPVMTLSYGSQVEVLQESGERWVKVRLLDDKEYWVQRNDLRLDEKPLTLDELVDESQKFLGLPYRWGGNSGFGYDCSGFIQTLFAQGGISLPRDASQQVEAVNVIKVDDEARKGDLLFFGRKGRITHVGLCLGGGNFIHAITINAPHCVRINNVGESEWKEKLICMRRVKHATTTT